MSINKVIPGKNAPHEINVVVEIPANSDPVKYEVDKETGVLMVDRLMPSAMRYPCNYGYVPQTLSDDGDPVDVLVLTPFPLFAGTVVKSRPIGMLRMTDDGGKDTKILAVPIDKLTKFYQNVKSYQDIPKLTLDIISNFFEHYKDLEPGKWVKLDGWDGVEAAHKEIVDSIARYGK